MRSLEQVLSAWSLQGIHITRKITIYIPLQLKRKGTKPDRRQERSRLVVYRQYFIDLWKVPKSDRDQLVIGLPMFEGHRTGEIGNTLVDYFDFSNGILQVMDSKQHQIRLVPLHPAIAKLAERYIHTNGLTTGYLFTSQTKVGRPRTTHQITAISDTQLVWIWHKHCTTAGIPLMSPRMGRKYFACVWHYGDAKGNHKKSMRHLQAILGHKDSTATDHYLPVDFEALRREFYEGLEVPFQDDECSNTQCPIRVEGCRCKMFQNDKIEVKT